MNNKELFCIVLFFHNFYFILPNVFCKFEEMYIAIIENKQYYLFRWSAPRKFAMFLYNKKTIAQGQINEPVNIVVHDPWFEKNMENWGCFRVRLNK